MTLGPSVGSSYDALRTVVTGLDDDAAWSPTGCRGWVVRDLVFHLRADCVRALVAVHTPSDRPADCDAVAYWRHWGSDAATADAIRSGTRTESAPYSWAALRDRWDEAASAARRALDEADPATVVTTQDHHLTVGDLVSTLVVEATLHHLDLVAHLRGAAGPAAAGLTEVRRVTTALLDRELTGWSDERVALVATGRAAPTDQERVDLGGAPVPVFS